MTDTTEPLTKAGQWLLDRSRWDDGMRGFFVRINATAGPDDMHRHVLAIENEARAPLLAEITYREASFEALAAEYTTLEHERDALLAEVDALNEVVLALQQTVEREGVEVDRLTPPPGIASGVGAPTDGLNAAHIRRAERARIAEAVRGLEETDDPASAEFDFVNGREAWEAGRDSTRAAVIAIVEGGGPHPGGIAQYQDEDR